MNWRSGWRYSDYETASAMIAAGADRIVHKALPFQDEAKLYVRIAQVNAFKVTMLPAVKGTGSD